MTHLLYSHFAEPRILLYFAIRGETRFSWGCTTIFSWFFLHNFLSSRNGFFFIGIIVINVVYVFFEVEVEHGCQHWALSFASWEMFRLFIFLLKILFLFFFVYFFRDNWILIEIAWAFCWSIPSLIHFFHRILFTYFFCMNWLDIFKSILCLIS